MKRPKKKDVDGLLPADVEHYWEQFSIQVLGNQPTDDWEIQRGLWHRLQYHRPASRGRILHKALRFVAERGDALPAFLVDIFEKGEKPSLRAAKEPAKFEAARNLVMKTPDISDNRLAKLTGVHRTTAKEWKVILLAGRDAEITPSSLPEYER